MDEFFSFVVVSSNLCCGQCFQGVERVEGVRLHRFFNYYIRVYSITLSRKRQIYGKVGFWQALYKKDL